MRNILMIAAVASVISTSAYAGVADNKAKSAADEQIAAAAAKTQEACGNASLIASVSWEQFDQVAENNKAELEKDRYKTEWFYGHAGERTVKTLQSLADICAKDEDYKAEIAKIAVIAVVPKAELSDAKSAFDLQDTALVIHSGHKFTRSASDFTSRLKALF